MVNVCLEQAKYRKEKEIKEIFIRIAEHNVRLF